ncbi:MAG: hypothetical protein NC429_12030 [Lachnospiraceae bacterium]|nr:hypothetical protein [Lachnospiraceae bacterium]
MSVNVKIIKWLTWIAVIFLIATCLVNINAETGIIILNSVLFSNSMILALCSGVCAGLVAVLADKSYNYYLDKNRLKKYLYNAAITLYSDFYYIHKNINELIFDRDTKIPKNLFTSRLPAMQNRLLWMVNTDYCVFRKKDKFMLAHNNFIRDKYIHLKNRMDEYIYFDIAFTEMEINQLKNIENTDENIYKVLKVLDVFAKEALETLDQYLRVLQKDSPKKFIWTHDKEVIHNSYLGLHNSGDVNDFLKRNWGEDN